MQLRDRGGLPGVTLTERLEVEARLRAMAPPVAVKGPILDALAGSSRVSPLEGMGLGMDTLNEMVPLEMLAGVAPVASTVEDAEPITAVLPRAWEAWTICEGRATVVWNPVKLN